MQTAFELHFQEWVDLGHEERDDKECKYTENNENGPTVASHSMTRNFHNAERRKPDPKGCGLCASLESQGGGHLWGRQRRDSTGFWVLVKFHLLDQGVLAL